MKGKETAKWSGSQKADKRQARKQKIQDAFTDTVEVEVIPAFADLHKDDKRILRVAAYCRVSTDQEAQATTTKTPSAFAANIIAFAVSGLKQPQITTGPICSNG